jgi:hypothetical protein
VRSNLKKVEIFIYIHCWMWGNNGAIFPHTDKLIDYMLRGNSPPNSRYNLLISDEKDFRYFHILHYIRTDKYGIYYEWGEEGLGLECQLNLDLLEHLYGKDVIPKSLYIGIETIK